MERKFLLNANNHSFSALRATELDMLDVVRKYNQRVFTERELQYFTAFLRECNRKIVAENFRRKMLDIHFARFSDERSWLNIGSLSVTLFTVFEIPEEFTAYLNTFAK